MRHAREQHLIAEASADAELQTTLYRLAHASFGPLSTPDEQRHRRLGIQIWAEALYNEQLLTLMRRGVDEPRKLLVERLIDAQRRGDFPRSSIRMPSCAS